MGTETGLALATGFFGGMFLTALILWFHERRGRQVLQDVSDRLRRHEARTYALLRESRDVLAIVDADATIRYVSPAADRILGRSSTGFAGAPFTTLLHPDDRDPALAALLAPPGSATSDEPLELRVQHHDGHWVTLEVVRNDQRGDPAVDGTLLACRDVTEQRRADTASGEARATLGTLLEHAPTGLALIGLDGQLVYVNRTLAYLLGRAPDQLTGLPALTLTYPDDREAVQVQLRRLTAGDETNTRIEQRLLHADGRPVWVAATVSLVRGEHQAPLQLVAQVEDLTERRTNGARLAQQALSDPLTGLPNRQRFLDVLQQALAAHPGAGQVTVLFLDLDQFKVVNDSLGHAAGDRLLVAVADRLRAAVRPGDMLARFGGDEFTILCTGVPTDDAALEIAARVADAVGRAITLEESDVFVSASVGIARTGGDLDTPETLLRNADTAMYRAKEQGRSRAELYDPHGHDQAIRSLRTGTDLHRALERGELRMHYQPIISLETGHLSGFEALLRWQHPERGLVPPDEFVSLAEETGLVVPIGCWALHSACRQAAAWHAQGAPITMSVNLSPRQLAEPALPATVASVLHQTPIDPDTVWLEITESALMRDAEAAITALSALRDLGVHLSVDDFGTGYSSMSYLQRFPVEALKVDRSFTDGLGREPENTAICTAVISLAHALGLRAVAEGVETADQLAELRTLGCEYGQGFLFGRPAPAERFGARPNQHHWSHLSGR